MRSYRLGVAVVLLTVALPVDAGEPMTIAVSPLQSFSPTDLRIRLRVEPSVDNRWLEVVADSLDFYRSSRIQMDGERAPKTIVLEFRSVPSGQYEVTGELMNSQGLRRAFVRQQAVVSPAAHEDR
jgi:hypothetical protein